MKNIYLLLALCLGLFAGCKPTDPQTFRIEKVLTPELMPLQGLTNPFRLEIKHPYLIIQNSDNLQDSIFQIYDVRNNELKCVFGSIGQGPKEYVMPWLLNNHLPEFIINNNSNTFQKFIIDKDGQATMKDDVTPAFQISLDKAQFIHDSLFIVNPAYEGIPYLLMSDMKHDEAVKAYAYRDTTLINYADDPNRVDNMFANKNHIVLCYAYKKQIDFLDTDFNLVKRVMFDDYVPKYEWRNTNEHKPSYIQGYLGNRYLYALFMGCTYNELEAREGKGVHLEVFDMDGNPIARYELQGERPRYFVVDEETFTLYSPMKGLPEDHLLMYKLEGLK